MGKIRQALLEKKPIPSSKKISHVIQPFKTKGDQMGKIYRTKGDAPPFT
jgi:hypothetical protein